MNGSLKLRLGPGTVSRCFGLMALALCLAAAQAVAQNTPKATPAVQALLDAAQNSRGNDPGRAEESLKSIEKALDLARTSGDKRGEVDAICAKGGVFAGLGQAEMATSLYTESQRLAEVYADDYGKAAALSGMGSVHEFKNRWDDARKAHRSALNLIGSAYPTLKSEIQLRIVKLNIHECQQHVHNRHLAEALRAYKRTESSLADLGPNHTTQQMSFSFLRTRILELQGRVAEANAAYQDLERRFDNDRERGAAAVEVFTCAYELEAVGYKTRAIPAYEAAIRLWTKARNTAYAEMAQNNLANVFIGTGDIAKGLEIHQHLLKSRRAGGDRAGIALSLLNIAWSRERLGQYEESIARYQDAADAYRGLNQWWGEAKALNAIGWVELQRQRVPEATKHMNAALNLEKGRNPELHAQILTNLAEVDLRQGDPLSALAKFYQAMETRRSLGASADEAEAMRSIGSVFRDIGRLSTAEPWYLSALRMSLEMQDRFQEARTRAHLGLLYSDLGLLSQAAAQHKLALKVSKAVGDRDTEAGEMNNLSLVYKGLGDYPRAAQLFNAAVVLSKRIGNKHWESIQTHNVGTIFERTGQNSKALAYYRRAFKLAVSGQDASESARALTDIALIEGLLKRPSESARHYLEAAEMIERMSGRFESSADARMSFQKRFQKTYGGCVDSLLSTGNVTEAFAWTEKMKGRALLNLMANRVDLSGSLTTEERKQWESQKANESRLNLSMIAEGVVNEPGSKKRYARLKSELRVAEDRFQAYSVTLSARHPDLARKRSLTSTAKLVDLARVIPEDTAILEYVTLQGNQAVERVKLDHSALFVVTRKGANVYANAFPIRIKKEQLKRLCTEFHDACADPRKPYQQLARKLYEVLVAPAAGRLQGKARIVVCPDGPLLEIPFQALYDGRRYLSEQYTMSYCFSASGLLAQLKSADTRRKPEKDTVLAFANPAFGDERRFGDDPSVPGQRPIDTASRPIDSASRPIDAASRPIETASRTTAAALRSVYLPRGGAIRPLPGTQREADMLGKFFSDASIYSGAGAQESTAKAEIGKFRYLHFATHGFVNDGAPLLSSLILAKPIDDKEDGFLTAREILDLNLSADLAVLSACNTGRGEIKDGEGVLGLSWALTVAGCPTQVVSQWAVDDASTAMLMMRFYENLKLRKMGKAAALNEAEGWLRKQNPKYLHPYYWAPFVLNGAWK